MDNASQKMTREVANLQKAEFEADKTVPCAPAIVVDDHLPIVGTALDLSVKETAVAIAVELSLHMDAAHKHSTLPIGNPCM
jgi:hypothetical protein